MNDDRIERALREIGDKRLSATADRAIRARIEENWAAGGPRVGFRWPTQLLVAAAAVAITLGLGSAALGAGADSVLWPARVAIEDLGLNLRVTAEARADYLLDLIDSRTTEAARQEAAGHALAAGKALEAREEALKRLTLVATKNEPPRTVPPLPSVFKSPEPSRSPEAPRTPSPEPSRTPPATPRTPEPTPARTPDRTPEPPLEPTLTPLPPLSTPSRTPEITRSPLPPTIAPTAIVISGTVRYEDGTIPLKACISTSSVLTNTCGLFAENGVYSIKTTSFSLGATIRLHAYTTERGGVYSGSEAAVVTAPTTLMPPITLRPLTTTSPSLSPTPLPTRSPLPTPTPTVSGEYVIFTGTVRYDDGTIPTKACISTSPTLPTTCAGFAENGTFTIKTFLASFPLGTTVRLYAYATERGLYSGSEIAVVTSPTTTFPTITLRPQALPSPTPTASPV